MDILEQLKRLETQLHSSSAHSDSQFMDAVLHEDFTEIGRCGRHYTRQEILDEFKADASLPAVQASDFKPGHISEAVWQLTYQSAHIDDNGRPYRNSLRSSIWIQTKQGFQLRFHQGTPVD